MHPLLPLGGQHALPDSIPAEERRILRRGAPQTLAILPAPRHSVVLRIEPRHPPPPLVSRGGGGWLRALLRGPAPKSAPAL